VPSFWRDADPLRHYSGQDWFSVNDEELLVFLVGAEAHDVLDACAGVPATIEENDFPRRGQFGDITLEIPLPAFSLGRRRKGDDTADPRVKRIGNASDEASLARRISSLKNDAHLATVTFHLLLHLDQFDLKISKFFDMFVLFRRLVIFGSLGQYPILFCRSCFFCQFKQFAARFLCLLFAIWSFLPPTRSQRK
jgi:hypothetical protein